MHGCAAAPLMRDASGIGALEKEVPFLRRRAARVSCGLRRRAAQVSRRAWRSLIATLFPCTRRSGEHAAHARLGKGRGPERRARDPRGGGGPRSAGTPRRRGASFGGSFHSLSADRGALAGGALFHPFERSGPRRGSRSAPADAVCGGAFAPEDLHRPHRRAAHRLSESAPAGRRS